MAIDLSALKQLILDNRDDCDEEVEGSKGDYPRSIDTSAMLSGCLTKTLTSCQLTATLSTGIFDMRPTEESLAIKAKNRKWRASKKEQERLQGPDDEYFSWFVMLIEVTPCPQVLSSSDLVTPFFFFVVRLLVRLLFFPPLSGGIIHSDCQVRALSAHNRLIA